MEHAKRLRVIQRARSIVVAVCISSNLSKLPFAGTGPDRKPGEFYIVCSF